MRVFKFLAIGFVVSCSTLAAAATVTAYDNFTSSNGGLGYNTTALGWELGGSAPQLLAMEFEAGRTGTLADVTVAIAYDTFLSSPGSAGDFELQLYSAGTVAKTGGGTMPGPGTAMYTWASIGTDGPNWHGGAGVYNTPTTVTASGGPTLHSGTEYWLVATPLNGVTARWDENNNGSYSAVDFEYKDGSNDWGSATGSPNGAFEVQVSTPGPAAIIPFALGFVRRRRAKTRG